ncbi:MAG: DUF6151 family protein [Arenibacterium sp.]
MNFSCDCGSLTGQLSAEALRFGTYLECFCNDCRAAHLHFEQPDPRPGGIEIFQTTPDQITIEKGSEHLRILRLGPKGPFRWYATCCNAPFCNTLNRPSLPFAGLIAERLNDKSQLGRVRVRSFLPGAPGKHPRHEGAFFMISRFVFQMARARFTGHWKKTPFFDVKTGYPIVKPVVLDRATREALKAR